MTCNGNCGCATLGPDHDPDARHPQARSCEHDEKPACACDCDCCSDVEWDSEGKDC